MGKKSKSRKKNNQTTSVRVQGLIILLLIAVVGYLMNLSGCESIKQIANETKSYEGSQLTNHIEDLEVARTASGRI